MRPRLASRAPAARAGAVAQGCSFAARRARSTTPSRKIATRRDRGARSGLYLGSRLLSWPWRELREMSEQYEQFAAALTERRALQDPWYDGQPRFAYGAHRARADLCFLSSFAWEKRSRRSTTSCARWWTKTPRCSKSSSRHANAAGALASERAALARDRAGGDAFARSWTRGSRSPSSTATRPRASRSHGAQPGRATIRAVCDGGMRGPRTSTYASRTSRWSKKVRRAIAGEDSPKTLESSIQAQVPTTSR